MGNSASSDSGVASSSTPRVFLTPALQEDIQKSFQSQYLQHEWEKHQAHILNLASKREEKVASRKAKQQEAFEKRKREQEARNQELQEVLDEQSARLSDAITAMEYDLNRAEKKVVTTLKTTEVPSPCLDERVALMECLTKFKSPGTSPCTLFVSAVEKCAKNSLEVAE